MTYYSLCLFFRSIAGPVYSSLFAGFCAFGRTLLFPYDIDSKGMILRFNCIPFRTLLPKIVFCGQPNAPLMIFFFLFFFFKGITTYEYVVAMRTQSEPPGPSVNEDQQSLPSSPMSSAPTAISGSSLGLQYRGAWCTPPRIFMDQLVICF